MSPPESPEPTPSSIEDTIIPPESGEPRLEAKPDSAAGLTAVISSLKYTAQQAGLRGRALLRLNQQEGFDCPSCAWPDPKDRSFAEFCENGARATADEATTRRVGPEFFAEHSVESLRARSDHWLNDQGRITHPMVLREGASHYAPIEWDEAFEMLGARLRSMPSPDHAVFYTSGRTSNEAAFLYQLFARKLGTNNLPDCSNMCHESTGVGLSQTIGVGKGTVTLEDFDEADVIAIIGQNPGTNHPRMLSALQSAKEKGARIIAINPLEEVGLVRFKHPQRPQDLFRGTPLADLHLPVRVGGDLALLLALMKVMVARGYVDTSYVEAKTEGFEALKAQLEGLDMSRLEADSGISAAQIEAAAEMLGTSKATLACWAMGITQHENGVANVQAVVNLLLLGGHFGRPGAGACPVRGHSNVQGDRTVGIWEKLPPWSDRLGEHFGFPLPTKEGTDVVGAIEAMLEGRVEVFFAMGGNFLSATPDTDRVAEGFAKTGLSAHVSTKLNRSHLYTGTTALILPCLGRTERDSAASGPQFVTVENSMGIVSRSQGRLPPASSALLSEPSIVARLARATFGDNDSVSWVGFAEDYDRIRDAIEAVVPGFDDYNQRVRTPNGFPLPNVVRDGGFGTPGGKGRFTVHGLPDLALAEGRYWLTTIRSHDQFNTTVYDLDDRYRGIFGHRHVVLMSESDVAAAGLTRGQKVSLHSWHEGVERKVEGFVVVPYDIPDGNLACYFPEANPLVPLGLRAEGSRTPASKRVEVSLRPM